MAVLPSRLTPLLRPGFPRSLGVVVASALVSISASAEIDRELDGSGVVSLSNKRTRKQVGASKPAAVSSPVFMPRPGGSARSGRYAAYIAEAAKLYHIPEALVRAVIKVESNFDPRAVSPANAHGLMQLMPRTAERMMVSDIMDPRQNILGGTRYLRLLANTFNGNLQLSLAGYNAGEGAVAKYGGIPPYEETQHYVAKVTEYYQKYSRH